MTLHPAVAQSALVAHRTRMGRPVLWSLGAHVLLVLLGWGYATFLSGPKIDLNQKPIQARLVRKGTPRDAKLLPRIEEAPAPPQKVEAQPVDAPAPPAEKPAAVAIPTDKPAPKTQKAAPQAGVSDGDRRKRLFGAFSQAGKARDEEQAGAEDGSELGDASEAEGDQYWALLQAQVRQNYDVSQTISDQERLRLRAQLLIRIGRAGEVLDTKLAKPSGNALFDSAVLLAVKRAQPFSPPPPHLRDALQRSGVVLEFTP